MKIGIVSDIHGNIGSLLSAYLDLNEIYVEGIYNLGDSVERGNNIRENRAVDFLRLRPIVSIRGNHDRKIYLNGSNISIENLDFLDDLPESLELEDVLMFHSSLLKPDAYLFGELDIEKEYLFINKNYPQTRFYLFGHIHEKIVYSIDPSANKIRRIKPLDKVSLDKEHKYFICPGALCSHAIKHPSYAVLDIDENILEFNGLREI